MQTHMIYSFKGLITYADHNEYLTLNNLKEHNTRYANDRRAGHLDEVTPLNLRIYMPELNLDECLNADLEDGVMRGAPSRSKVLQTRRLSATCKNHHSAFGSVLSTRQFALQRENIQSPDLLRRKPPVTSPPRKTVLCACQGG